ncbi:MAG: carbohydrate ABC transporter permease [Actinomycetota bacterium]
MTDLATRPSTQTDDGAEIAERTPRRRRRDWTGVALSASLLLTGLIVSAPIFIAIFTSFTPPNEVFDYPPRLLPENWTLENYETAWTSSPMGRFLINSFIQSGIITFAQVVLSVLAAYAFAFIDFPGRSAMFALVIASLMIPFELTFIPNFLTVSDLGWANTYAGLTVPFLASAFGVFLLRQFFLSFPSDLRDAAVVDGAGQWTFLWKIVVPLSKGPIGALAIFSFLSAWNQYLWPLVITNEESMRTTQIGIRFFLFDQERNANYGAIMAAAVIVMLPTLLAFLVAQRQLVRGIAMTGIKG